MLNQKLMGNPVERLYVDDVFSTYLYTGNGSTQTINNGIDLAGEGGLVWTKARSAANAHVLFDTSRGPGHLLSSNNTDSDSSPWGQGFTSNGFSFLDGSQPYNASSLDYASWTFRRAKKFFDVVTYTGNGASNRQIAHELGAAPGFITTKSTSTTGDWNSYHRSATGDLKLNTPDAQAASRALITAADAGTFSVSGAANTNGVQYVAYLWAHDPSEDGIVQCGSFTTDASGNATVNLGWEPQYLLIKNSVYGAGGDNNWMLYDTMRGLTVAGQLDAFVHANESAPETVGSRIGLNATGFTCTLGNNETYIYLAIRRPNKPPKTGAEVYNAGTNSYVYTGWPVDLNIASARVNGSQTRFVDRLRGYDKRLVTSSTAAEATSIDPNAKLDNMSYAAVTESGSVVYAFRRAPGFFDVVCFQGNGSIPSPGFDHNLGVPPEFMIIKRRDTSTFGWPVYVGLLGETQLAYLNRTDGFSASGVNWLGTPTATKFFPANFADGGNASSLNYVAYLFASLPGISKVGSYVGNGGSQTIDCGFSSGARFFLVKATSTTGNWWVFDSARGIVSSFDPALALNSTAAEVTSADAVDPFASGITVNQEATCSINATGVNYVFLAIA